VFSCLILSPTTHTSQGSVLWVSYRNSPVICPNPFDFEGEGSIGPEGQVTLTLCVGTSPILLAMALPTAPPTALHLQELHVCVTYLDAFFVF
jgi:hypothetical protein